MAQAGSGDTARDVPLSTSPLPAGRADQTGSMPSSCGNKSHKVNLPWNLQQPHVRVDVSRRRRRPQNRQRRGKRREDREDRGEPQWHGDHRDRWHQPASTATDPLNNDPWRPALRER